jgi:hypothetical protein
MKCFKYKFILILMMYSNSATSQVIKNGGFELWTNPKPNVWIPYNWSSIDGFVPYTTVQPSSDAYEGNTAVRFNALKNLSNTGSYSSVLTLGSAMLSDSIGLIDARCFTGGDSTTQRPFSISGYYKFFPDSSTFDQAVMSVWIYKSSALSTQLYGNFCGHYLFTPQSSYTRFEKVLNYPTLVGEPDSIIIIFYYNSNNTSFTPPGYLLLDKLEANFLPLHTTTIGMQQSIQLTPNPAQSHLQLTSTTPIGKVLVTNMLGQVQLTHNAMHQNTTNINLNKLANGVYVLHQINTGFKSKFVVAR